MRKLLYIALAFLTGLSYGQSTVRIDASKLKGLSPLKAKMSYYSLPGSETLLPNGITAIYRAPLEYDLIAPSARNTVTLPVRVMGSHASLVDVSTTINLSSTTNADRLWLRMHSPSYSDRQWNGTDYTGHGTIKTKVRLNGSNWVDIVASEIVCPPRETRWDCPEILHEQFFTIALSKFNQSLTTGDNTVEVRFTYEDGEPSSGLRVLGFAILASTYSGDLYPTAVNAASMIDGTTLVWEDPSTYSIPSGYNDPDSIAQGKALWDHVCLGGSNDLRYTERLQQPGLNRAREGALGDERHAGLVPWRRESMGGLPGLPLSDPFGRGSADHGL